MIPDRRSLRTDALWASMGSCEHLLQIYGTESVFLDALEGFIGSGLRAGESAVVIATPSHIHELEKRLRARWIDLDRARWQKRYTAVLAQETLSRFMVDDWPHDGLFSQVSGELLARGRTDGGRVRAFAEMVTLLWHQGRAPAALRLELMWSRLAQAEDFPVFCAYPKGLFESQQSGPVQSLCAAHSQLLPG